MANNLCRFITIETVDEFQTKTIQDLTGDIQYIHLWNEYYEKQRLPQNSYVDTPDIYETDIVFIKDIHIIWTQGEYWIPTVPDISMALSVLRQNVGNYFNALTKDINSVSLTLSDHIEEAQVIKADVSKNTKNIKDLTDDSQNAYSMIADINDVIMPDTFFFTATYDLLSCGYHYFTILPDSYVQSMNFVSDTIFVRMEVRLSNSSGMLLQDTLWKCILKRDDGDYNDAVKFHIDKIYDTKLSTPSGYQISPAFKQEGIFTVSSYFNYDLFIKITGPAWLNITGDLLDSSYIDNQEILSITE